MDQKLSDLITQVEGEARKFASFDDYLASKDKPETEWQKPASDVVVNSSNDESTKVDETVESSAPSSAAVVTPPTKEEHPHSRTTPEYIANGSRTEPAHPVIPTVVLGEEPPSGPAKEIPMVKTELVLSAPINWDGQTLRSVDEVATQVPAGEEPDWWRKVYLGFREEGLETLKTPEAIIDRIHVLTEECDRRRRAIQGLRSALDDVLKGENSEVRARHIGNLDMDYRARRNKQAADRMKADRGSAAPKAKATKSGIGIKDADTFATALMLRGDKLKDQIQKIGKLDEATAKYIDEKWGGK